MEEWRDIPGFPGYKASSLGRIEGPRGGILKPGWNGSGYSQVEALGQSRLVHLLVGITFLGPKPFPNWQIDHITEGDKSNNKVDNLQWLSPADNRAKCGPTKASKTGVKGLCFDRGWKCQIERCGISYQKHFKERSDAEKWLVEKRLELGI